MSRSVGLPGLILQPRVVPHVHEVDHADQLDDEENDGADDGNLSEYLEHLCESERAQLGSM